MNRYRLPLGLLGLRFYWLPLTFLFQITFTNQSYLLSQKHGEAAKGGDEEFDILWIAVKYSGYETYNVLDRRNAPMIQINLLCL